MASDEPKRLVVGPFNRVEGDLEVKLDVADGAVREAWVTSTLFRGFEAILRGRRPDDALTVAPRICGICSVSQSVAAARALADAAGARPPPMGALAIDLIHAAENAADHLTHFNLFFMPDFVRDAYAARPWHAEAMERFAVGRGRSAGAAVEARAKLLHVMGVLAGHWPHTLAIQPGGITRAPDSHDKIRLIGITSAFRSYLEARLYGAPLAEVVALGGERDLADWRTRAGGGDLRFFLDLADDVGLADLGRGQDLLLSHGAYPSEPGHLYAGGCLDRGRPLVVDLGAVREDHTAAWLEPETGPLHPFDGRTVPFDGQGDVAYSWCKAPRLEGRTVEVGALARQAVDGQRLIVDAVARTGANVRTRVLARLVELARTALWMERAARSLDPREPFFAPVELPREGRGLGVAEAARGSLGHWLVIEKGRIANYQIVAPTTWNFSPRDALGLPGPLEKALVGTPVRPGERTPVSVQHVVRSYDPCMVCTVH